MLEQQSNIPKNFEKMRENILHRLKMDLPQTLSYHDINHTLSVEKAAIRLCELEHISPVDQLILRTAILYHDAGFIFQYTDNEQFAEKLVKTDLPHFAFADDEIERIIHIIRSTEKNAPPSSKLDQIMSDSDHDYFGREDYHKIANYLREELAIFGTTFHELEWIDFQLNYLEGKHQFLTESAKKLRNLEKTKRIVELKQKRNSIHQK